MMGPIFAAKLTFLTFLTFSPKRCSSDFGVGCGVQAPQHQPIFGGKLNIINGVGAKPHSWPWAVLVITEEGPVKENGDQDVGICGGSLLRVRDDVEESDIVVTAGHCVISVDTLQPAGRKPTYSDPRKMHVGAGVHNVTYKEETDQIRNVAAIRYHPYFSGGRGGFTINDVAIVKLSQPIQFTDVVRPVCLPAAGAPIPVGKLCAIAGWGRNDYRNEKSMPQTLQQLAVPVQPASLCRRLWPGVYMEKLMICAGSVTGESGQCQGDSGSMLACREDDGRWVQHGIISFAVENCVSRGKPAMTTRVSNYVDWIQNTMNELTSLYS